MGYLSGKTAAYKNAERQIKIAKTVTAYVIVFSICWLPQKIFMIVYIMQVSNVKAAYMKHLYQNFIILTFDFKFKCLTSMTKGILCKVLETLDIKFLSIILHFILKTLLLSVTFV